MNEFKFRENNFDVIRLLAAIQVMFLHGYHWFGLPDGWLVNFLSLFPGVPIFFVTSGFLLGGSLQKRPQMVSYFKNRILRIYPALYVCFFIGVLVAAGLYEYDMFSIDFITFVFAQLTFLQFFNPDTLFHGYGTGILNGSLWTISIELQFYILLPIIYPILIKLSFSRLTTIIFMLVLICLNQLKIYLNHTIEAPSFLLTLYGVSILPYLYMFVFGVLIQNNMPFVKNILVNKGFFWLFIYMSLGFVLDKIGVNVFGNNINPLSALILSCLVVSMAYTRVSSFSKLLGGNDISYGIYLYHMLLVNVLIQLSVFSPLQNLIVMSFLTIILAIGSWKLIEKPCLTLK